LSKSCAGANIISSQAELVFILEYYFASKSYSLKEVLNRTIIHQLVTKFLDKGNVCEISSFHGGEYDVQSCLLGCTAV
jgi:hypothetical protein